MTFGPRTHYHTCFIVQDLPVAMEALASTFQVQWMPPQETEAEVWAGAERRLVPIRYVYSIDEGHYMELIQAVPGTIYELEVGKAAEFHHCGYSSDDIVTDVGLLEANGHILEVTMADEATPIPSRFAYVRHELGPRVELVTTEVVDRLESQLALYRSEGAQAPPGKDTPPGVANA